jgi:hypothetical protein
MRRKPQPKPETLVPVEILEQAKRSIAPEHGAPAGKCSVCGGEVTLPSSEPLCWVCRRLKISAWRENDQQMPAQE